MAKSPIAGLVKRRLGREIGDVAAIRFYRSCLSHTVLRLASDPRWQTVLALTPADFGKLIAEETDKWGKVVKFSGAKAE